MRCRRRRRVDDGAVGHGADHLGGAEHTGDRAGPDDAGRADADPEQWRGGQPDDLSGQVQDDLEHRALLDRVNSFCARVIGHGALGAGEDPPVEVEHGCAERLVLGQVDPDDLQTGPVDVDEGGRLAGPHLVGGPELDGVAALEQFGDEVAHRGLTVTHG